MDKIYIIFKNLYQNTYQNKYFRHTLNLTRLLVLFIDSLIIALLVNLYITGIMSERLLIGLIIIGTIISYNIGFKYVYKQYMNYKKTVNLNLKYVYYYFYVEAFILSYIIIKIYEQIKSLYV